MLIRNVALVLFCAISSGLVQGQQPAPTPSIVYAVRNPDSIKQYKTNAHVVREMVNRLVMAVTGQSDVAKAWGSLVSPGERVGIKISAAGGELFTTHHDIVNAIVDGLAAAGHPRSSIIVWDRSLGGIKEAGYRPSVDGYQVKAIAPHDGYDAKAVLSAPLAGKLVWGDFEYVGDTGKMRGLHLQHDHSEHRQLAPVRAGLAVRRGKSRRNLCQLPHRKKGGVQFDGRPHRATCRRATAAAELRSAPWDAVCEQGPGGSGCRRIETIGRMAEARESPSCRSSGSLH